MFSKKFESQMTALKHILITNLPKDQDIAGNHNFGLVYESIAQDILIQSLQSPPLSIPLSAIKRTSNKSTYPDIEIEIGNNRYGININVSRDERGPSFDLGPLETYRERHLDQFAAEYSVVIRLRGSGTFQVFDVYIEPTYRIVGYSETYRGVLFRQKDGNLKPKQWLEFELGQTHWSTLKEFTHGLKLAQSYRREQIIQNVAGKEVFAEYADLIRRARESDIQKIITQGEGEEVEFKEASFWNRHKQKKEDSLVENVITTIAGFLNSHDGALLIGIDNGGTVIGLASDYKAADVAKSNRDGYELALRNILKDRLGVKHSSYYRFSFYQIDGLDICLIRIDASSEPVFYRGDFYKRSGNQTLKLTAEDTLKYIAQQWDTAH